MPYGVPLSLFIPPDLEKLTSLFTASQEMFATIRFNLEIFKFTHSKELPYIYNISVKSWIIANFVLKDVSFHIQVPFFKPRR